jgi:hypothetical protein
MDAWTEEHLLLDERDDDDFVGDGDILNPKLRFLNVLVRSLC